jgi:hypothetical protein
LFPASLLLGSGSENCDSQGEAPTHLNEGI